MHPPLTNDKIFQKNVKKMLTENKFSKYLIYAIGEIIPAIIGILIAISLNNVNEKTEKIEDKITFLLRLKDDIKQDINDLSQK
jgi:cell division protein FtsL